MQLICPSCDIGLISAKLSRCPSCQREYQTEGRILMLDQNAAEEDYSAEGAGGQASVGEEHFWFSVRRERIVHELDRVDPSRRLCNFVEYGCSNGMVMAHLEKAGWALTGVEMHAGALRNAEKVTTGPLVCGRLESVTFDEPLDAVGLFDVIEHLDDDLGALRHAIRQLHAGGLLIVTVPALPALRSDFDDLLGHKRRYTKRMLRSHADALGLDVVALRYFFSFSVPLVWLQRKLGGSARGSEQERWERYYRPPMRSINRLLGFLGRMEMALPVLLSPPLGTSLILISRKR